MTDNVGISSDADAAAQRASEQARLRKERREAKLKAGGSARLDRITGMGGRPKPDFEEPPSTNVEADTVKATAAAAATSNAATIAEGDPDEVDISSSEHFYKPNTTARIPHNASSPAAGQAPEMSEDALRQMMMGFDPAGAQGGQGMPNPMGGMPGANGEEDPIMKMMSQMMGGAGGQGGSPFPGMGAGGMPDLSALGQMSQAKPVDRYTALWRLLHAIVALGLGLYITILTPFTGTKLERDHASLAEIKEHEHEKQMFFWVFATAEACLLTTRFFLDKGRAPPAGIVWTVIGFLPEPFKGYTEVVVRYGQIFTTVRSDILACMFVLGVCHWLRA